MATFSIGSLSDEQHGALMKALARHILDAYRMAQDGPSRSRVVSIASLHSHIPPLVLALGATSPVSTTALSRVTTHFLAHMMAASGETGSCEWELAQTPEWKSSFGGSYIRDNLSRSALSAQSPGMCAHCV
jgi:hypothetical protein